MAHICCDNFLYGFKGGLAPAAIRLKTWPKWHESHERTRSSGSSLADMDHHRGPTTRRRGKAGHRGRLGLRRASCGGATGAAARRQVRRPEQARRGLPAATTPRVGKRANGQRPRAPGQRGQPTETGEGLKSWHLRGSGRSALPEPPARTMGVSRNLSRALRVPAG